MTPDLLLELVAKWNKKADWLASDDPHVPGDLYPQDAMGECADELEALVRGAVPPAPQPEICICAAILLDDGSVFYGHRHGDAMKAAAAHGKTPIGCTQGFITTRHRFVGRDEGRQLQDAAGMSSADAEGYRGSTLFSEDLYRAGAFLVSASQGPAPARKEPNASK